MMRVRGLLMTFVPGLVAGGLLFGSAFGHASAGSDSDVWPAGPDVGGSDATSGDVVRRAKSPRTAQAPRVPPTPPRPPGPGHRVPPTPPAPPTPPTPPAPPTPPVAHVKGGAITVRINGGKIQIEGIDEFARQQIDNLRHMLRNNPNIPADVRDRVLSRMDRARVTLDKRLKNLSLDDLDKLDEEMERMGDELEKAMEGLEDDLDKLGDKLGKDIAKKFGKDFAKKFKPGKFKLDLHQDHDDDDDDRDADAEDDADPPSPVDISADDHNMSDVITDLKNLPLRADQRDRIVKLRASLERDVDAARKQLDDASRRLETALDDVNVKTADIERYVDQISSHEAAIRKARLRTWVEARRVLDPDLRKKIEEASKKKHK